MRKTKQQIIEELQSEIQATKEREEAKRLAASKKKYYCCRVYCTNCNKVRDVSIPEGTRISAGDCVVCRVYGSLLLVSKD